MLAVVPFGFNSVQSNSLRTQAGAIAQQYLDDERNALLHNIPVPAATTSPIDAGQSYEASGVADSGYGTFAIAPDGCTTVQNAGASANVYSCSVTVSWTESGSARSVTVQSYATK